MKKLFVSILFLIIIAFSTKASHIPGGTMTYACVGPNTYELTMTLFVRCPSSLSSSYSSSYFTVTNNCGLANPVIPTFNQVGTEVDVSQTCPTQQSVCNGGTIPGVKMYTYTATVTFPGPCDSWSIAFDLCCRDNSTNINGASSASMYFETNMFSQTAPCDNSPIITGQPIPYVCAGQQNTYCLGAIDPDGDSLAYTMINASDAGGVPLTYNAPYSFNAPLQNFSLDPQTGCITFNQPTTGNFVVAILIEAYDANGNITSSMIRDFQIEVINCSNNVGSGPATGVSNVSGGSQLGPNQLEICEGQTICFDIVFTDPDPTDTLVIDTANTNVLTALPGAIITTSGANPLTVNVCWTVPAGASPNNTAVVSVTDNKCPIDGVASYSFNINVINSTVAPPDMTICGNQQANLWASGGTVFNWQSIAGDPIIVGTNFSCNPCQNPVATPSQTTTYVVTSNLSGGCVNTDTVTVNVVPDFTVTVNQSTPSACLQDDIFITTTVNPGGAGYTYSWSPSTFLNNSNVSNPVMTPTAPGTYTYYLDVVSPQGCLKQDSVTVNVAAAYSPDITILTNDTNIFCGDSVRLDVDLGGGIPPLCQASATTCTATTTQSQVGTGTSSGTINTPLYGFYEDGRTQMLYTAAELNAMGFIGGKITEVALNVITVSSSQPYSNFNIKMGCTSLNDFTTVSDFVPGLTTVYTNPSFTPVVGWNNFVLTTSYDWDGISNIIVEICFDNNSWTSSDAVQYSTMPSLMTIHAHMDGASGCTLDNTAWSYNTSTNRPNLMFTHCPTTPDPNNYTFSWTGGPLNNNAIQNPYGFPNSTVTYTVTVTDNLGGCSDTASVLVNVQCGQCYPPNPTWTNVSCNGGNDGQIIVSPIYTSTSNIQTITYTDSASGAIVQTTPNYTGATDTLNNIPAGTYIITITDTTGCSADTTVTITEPTPVVISNITADNLICIGSSIQVSATASGGTGPNYTLNWSNNVTGNSIPGNGPHTVNPTVSPTCYVVYATDMNNCNSAPDSVCISLYPNIIANSSGNDTICPNASTTISANAVGGSGVGYNFDWYDSNNLSVGNGASITVTPNSSPATYYAVVTDNCTTPADTAWVTVYWYPLPQPAFTADVKNGCYPITVKFVNLTPANQVAYASWNFGDGAMAGAKDSVTHTYNSPGCVDVTLTVTSPEGCVNDTTYVNYICPYDYPVADFTMNPPITDLLNTEVDFTNLSSGAVSYIWDFNTGVSPDSSTDVHPTHIFPADAPGMYPVVLTAINAEGCIDTTLKYVIINGVYLFYMPNSFTPNGDGKNDIFKPYGEGIDFEKYEFSIYDRWGHLIFHTDNLLEGWDGSSIENSPVPNGVYVWKIKAKDAYNGVKKEHIGHVTVIR